MDYMHVGELDIDDNEPPNWERERLWDNMPGPPFPSDKTWAPPATLNSAHGSQASPPSGLTTSGTNNDRISYSGASSCEGSWASSTTDHDQAERDLNWDEWEEGSDSAPIKPKNEPVDDEDITMSEVKIPTLASPEKSIVAPGQKRGRGRPRKNPIPAPTNGTKVTKGRSKTGCITCRKRKKKCDEAKPGCMNCEKNSVLCEGYNEKQIWKSGKDRDQGRTNREAFPSVTLPTLVQGLDTPEDKFFLRHYINRLSNVLTVEPKSHNAFKDILLTLATSQPGLLHSILSISSLHIDLDTPYGEGILQINPAVTKESLRQRSNYHTTEARNYLYGAFEKSELLDKDSSEYHLVLAALYGQMLCLVVRTLIEGNPRGEHRVHLKAYQKLIRESPPESTQLHTFITEFFQYHICADDLLWHPETDSTRLSLEETGSTPHDHTSRLVGVTDGLFCHLRDITTLRNEIRSRLAGAKDQPAVSYAEIFKANDITMALQSWSPNWPRSDNRVRVGELYKLTLWIYSFRTIYPPAASNADFLLGGSSLLSYMQERRSSVASSGQLSNGCSEDKHPFEQKISCSPNSSRTSSIHEEDGLPTPAPTHGTSSSRPPSPPPSRRPSQDDKRVTTSILDALSILETFEPNDQCQTLLLIPCLLIGTSCFDAALRPRIQAAVQAVREYTGLRNADRVQEVLNATWALMDAGDWVAVWDWQTVARHKGLDFCT